MENAARKRILILGGGFGGLSVAMELEKKLAQDPSVDIALSCKGLPIGERS
jgi:NADH dehydrogenase FAD-containing subunit